MKKKELKEKTEAVKEETRVALETMFNALNQGQQKKILKDDSVKELFARYSVNTE